MRYKVFLNRIKQWRHTQLFQDSFWAISGNLVKQGLSLIAGILIARILGSVSYGEYETIKTTLTYLAIVSTFGLGYTATKFVVEYSFLDKKDQLRQLISFLLKFTLAVSCVFGVSLFVFSKQISLFIDAPHLDGILRVSAGAIVLNAINSTQIAILSGLKRFKRIAKNGIIAGAITFVSSVILALQYGLKGAVYSLLISFSVQVILNWKVIRHETKSLHKVTTSATFSKKTIIGFSLPIAMQEALYTLVGFISTLIIIKFGNYGEVGIASAAALWESVVIYIPGVLKNVMFSYLVGAEDKKELVYKLLRIHFVTTAIPIAVIWIFSCLIVKSYGHTFQGLLFVLLIRVFSALFVSLSEVYCYDFISRGRTWIVSLYRLFRDIGALALGFIFVISTSSNQALWMAIGSFVMRIVSFFILRAKYRDSFVCE